jgi:hypothetical protein
MYEKTAFNALVLLKENLSRAINDELDSLEKILYLESLTEQQVNKITQSIEDKEKRVYRICNKKAFDLIFIECDWRPLYGYLVEPKYDSPSERFRNFKLHVLDQDLGPHVGNASSNLPSDQTGGDFNLDAPSKNQN